MLGYNAHRNQHLYNVSRAIGPPQRCLYGDSGIPGAAESHSRYYSTQRRPAANRWLHRRLIHVSRT